MSKYQKTPLSYEAQIQLLQSRGLIIPDVNEAETSLMHLNYYRLSSYWHSYKENDDKFKQQTHFKKILNYYLFDKELRIFLLKIIETFEVSFRSNWAYNLAVTTCNAHAYLSEDIIDKNKKSLHTDTISLIKKTYKNSKELFIEHYKKKYTDPNLPPIWAICEIFSFGNLVSFYSSLNLKYQKNICKIYNFYDVEVFVSFLENTRAIRNICAHHGRLWNRSLTYCRIRTPKKPKLLLEQLNINNNHNIYNSIIFLCYIDKIINSKSDWAKQFNLFILNSLNTNLITEDDLIKMGFPKQRSNIISKQVPEFQEINEKT